MIKVLVTGAEGQLGKCLQKIAGNYDSLDFKFMDSKGLDITNVKSINSAIESEHYDYFINCAAYTNVDMSESNIELAYEINAEAVRNLANACLENNVTLIHISTDFVFDGEKTEPYTEKDKPNPINIYGKSKLKGEFYVQEILTNYFIIRTSWVYSEYGHNFVKIMLSLGKERDQIGVVCDQFGSPTYAGDLAKIIIKIITENFQVYGIYHYCSEGVARRYDFAKAIFEESKISVKVLPINSEAYPTPAKRPFFSAMDKSKIKKVLQVEIPYWRDSLRECIKQLKSEN